MSKTTRTEFSDNAKKMMEAGCNVIHNNKVVWPEIDDYDKEPCVCCGKAIKWTTCYAVCAGDGASVLIAVDDSEKAEAIDDGFMGFYPIGPECRKKMPKEFTAKWAKLFPESFAPGVLCKDAM